jgi:hypothetical protein
MLMGERPTESTLPVAMSATPLGPQCLERAVRPSPPATRPIGRLFGSKSPNQGPFRPDLVIFLTNSIRRLR